MADEPKPKKEKAAKEPKKPKQQAGSPLPRKAAASPPMRPPRARLPSHLKARKHRSPSNPPPTAAPTAAELLAEDPNAKKIIKAKHAKNISTGVAHILATFNNTQVTITDMQRQPPRLVNRRTRWFQRFAQKHCLCRATSAQDAARQAMAHGMREVEIRVKGPGSGRESAIRALQAIGLEISVIKDVTPVPHNGCRPRKKRRV